MDLLNCNLFGTFFLLNQLRTIAKLAKIGKILQINS